MRSVFISILILVFAISLFISCGGKPDGTKITIWHQMQIEGRTVLQKACEQYMVKNQGVKIEILYKETEELRTGFQTASLAGTGPEIIYGPSDQVGPFSKMGIIMPMESLLTKKSLKEFDPKALTYFDGHLYQLGDRIGNHLALVYNKKLVPEPPKDSDELIAIGKELTKDENGDGRTDVYGLVWNYTEPYFFIPFLGGFGGWVMDNKANPTLDTPKLVEALKFLVEMRDVHRIIPKEADYDMADALFKEGRAGMIINGPWSWSGYKKAGIDIGIARIPKIVETDKWPSPMFSPKGYSINQNVKPVILPEVVKLIEYLTSIEIELEFTKALATIPSRSEAQNDTIVTGNETISSSREQLEVCRAMPVVPELRAIWDAMKPSYQAVLGGAMTPEEAAKQMQVDAVKKIKEMNE